LIWGRDRLDAASGRDRLEHQGNVRGNRSDSPDHLVEFIVQRIGREYGLHIDPACSQRHTKEGFMGLMKVLAAFRRLPRPPDDVTLQLPVHRNQIDLLD